MNKFFYHIFLTLGINAQGQEHQIKQGEKHAGMREIQGGSFIPLYGSDVEKVEIKTFYLDTYPITNTQFLQFIKENKKWRRSEIISLFADDGYLTYWEMTPL